MNHHRSQGPTLVTWAQHWTAAIWLALLVSWQTPAAADVLVFKDGDRVQGQLVRVNSEGIVFRSAHFGEIRVLLTEADVEVSSPGSTASTAPCAPPLAAPQAPIPAAFVPSGEPTSVPWWRPWTGRLSVGTELIHDTSKRKALVVDVRLSRKWSTDEFKGELLYDYREQNQTKESDQLKLSGYWRHTLPRRLFTVCRPVFEWNRHAFIDGEFTPYAVVQQEFGLGYSLLRKGAGNLNFGFSENIFSGWALNSSLTVKRRVESVFVEAEFVLPYNTTLTHRSVAYHSFALGSSGVEESLEITRKLTETLSISVQQQYQRNLPDLRLQDYRRTRLRFGYEF